MKLGLSRIAIALLLAPPHYHLDRRLPVGGEGGWDYVAVDSGARRLYVSRATKVLVFDVDTLKSVGEIPKTEGVHGIALAPDLGRGFTSNGRAGTVTVFELGTLKVLGEVKVTGENPDAILYDPPSQRVFTFNGRSGNATAIDAKALSVAGTIPLGGKPEFAVSDQKGHLYVNLEDRAELQELDPRELTASRPWPLPGCEEPTGLAIDRTGGRLFTGCGNRIMEIVSATDGHLVAKVPTGSGTDATAFDPGTGLAFSSNGEGTLTVAAEEPPGSFHVVENVETARGARTVALDERTHRLFLPTARFGPPPSPTAERPHPRPVILPDSFEILVVSPK